MPITSHVGAFRSSFSAASPNQNTKKRPLFGKAKRIKKRDKNGENSADLQHQEPLNMIANYLNHYLLTDSYAQRSNTVELFTDEYKISSKWSSAEDVKFDVERFLEEHDPSKSDTMLHQQSLWDLVTFASEQFDKHRRLMEKKKILEIRRRKNERTQVTFHSLYAFQETNHQEHSHDPMATLLHQQNHSDVAQGTNLFSSTSNYFTAASSTSAAADALEESFNAEDNDENNNSLLNQVESLLGSSSKKHQPKDRLHQDSTPHHEESRRKSITVFGENGTEKASSTPSTDALNTSHTLISPHISSNAKKRKRISTPVNMQSPSSLKRRRFSTPLSMR